MAEILGFSPGALRTAQEIHERWITLGLRGAFLARNIDTGEELGFDAERPLPLSSVVKLPQALVVCDLAARGELDLTQAATLTPDTVTPGPTGIARFSCPATVAAADLLYLTMAISDNAAADVLFDLVPPARVTERLHAWGYDDLVVRHRMRALYDAVARWTDNDMRLALRMAASATTAGGGHTLPVLDVDSGNVGTPRGLVGLLEDVWTDRVSLPAATTRVRQLLGTSVVRHRLAAELASDSVRVSSKTGTFLHTRHDVGVVEGDSTGRIAVAALTESTVPAEIQPEADRAIGRAARLAVEVLRD
ncbi:serine hydrolase [Georgenia halophila]|uniref:Serine hydrolase n=1 Tax=Georgenia halophila TaxID=620889 RepID=A0ABP8KZ08_9MICO